MAQNTTKVVVVGGGFGGVKTALELANVPGFQVQLISDNTHFEYHGALYRSAVGHSPKEVVIPLKEIFSAAKNVELVLDAITYIKPDKKLVVGSDGDLYSYDSLVLALGNTVNYFGIKGLKEHSETMHNISTTLRLRRKLIDLFSQPHRQAVRVAIIGGGASGVELAAELPAFAELIAKKHGHAKPRVNVLLIEASNRILPNLSTAASTKMTKRLITQGIELYVNIAVESCQEGALCLSAGTINADLLIWTAGSKPVDFFEKNNHVFTLGRGGRVAVDDYLQAQGHRNIYILGDNADTKFSGMAQTALFDALYVTRRMKALRENKKLSPYRPKPPVYVITGGGKWAIVQKGKRVLAGRTGWHIRRQADLLVFKHFEPYEKAIKTWRAGNKLSKTL